MRHGGWGRGCPTCGRHFQRTQRLDRSSLGGVLEVRDHRKPEPRHKGRLLADELNK